MPHDARVTIGGKRWRLVYDRMPAEDYGECDAPTARGKRLRIRRGLKRQPKALLETLIHEILHASCWQPLSEEFVTQAAEDAARILWAQGFRLEDGA